MLHSASLGEDPGLRHKFGTLPFSVHLVEPYNVCTKILDGIAKQIVINTLPLHVGGAMLNIKADQLHRCLRKFSV